MKRNTFIGVFVSLFLVFFGGGLPIYGENTLRFTTPPDPNMVSAFVLMDKGFLKGKVNINYIPSKGAGDIIAHLQSKDVDVAFFSVPGGAKLYAKGFKDIKLLGVHVWKALYVIAGNDVKGWKDLRKKKIFIAFRGGPPDIIARACMRGAGYNPDKDFNIEYLPSPQIKMLLLAGKGYAAVFPEPHISMLILKSRGKLKSAIDLQNDFSKSYKDWKSEEIPLGAMWIIYKNVKGKEEDIKAFSLSLKEANRYAMENPDEAGRITAKYFSKYFGGKFPAKAISMAIKSGRLKLEFRDIKKVKSLIPKYLKILNYPIPDEKIYYEVK